MIDPPRWSSERLDADRLTAIELFRQERMKEPLESYLQIFDAYRAVVKKLMDITGDLTQLEPAALDVLSSPDLRWAFRYLAGPPISEDDLKVLADAQLSASRLHEDPAMIGRILEVVKVGLDRRRFPWVSEAREPSEAERDAAILASAALIATSRSQANRRNEGKDVQERSVKKALQAQGLREVPSRSIATVADAPDTGQFCGESLLGNRKADVVVRLWDSRIMAIECKVSNSSVNSVKRLNNDAAAKAEVWRQDFGARHVAPTAVLSGVYELRNLEDAQERGLTLFWSHALAELVLWLDKTKTDLEA